MAGGPSTPELAIAVCEAGGLGFLAAGYKRADAVASEIQAVRESTTAPFGVNLFVPAPEPADPENVQDYLRRLKPEADRQGAELGEAKFDDDDYPAKLELMYEQRPAVTSFTFGCPDPSVVNRLHGVNTAVWVTVTNVAEALAAREAGADGLVAQGSEAGGHRGGFINDGSDEGGIGLLALLRVITRATTLPLIASGGVADGAGLAAVLCAGASAAQIGTALMLAPEAGTPDAQRKALAEHRPTRVTRAFTGRPARGIVNRFMDEHSGAAPVAYPEIHHVTSPLRAAARRAGDADAFNLWAGQAHELVQARPAGDIVRDMVARAGEKPSIGSARPCAIQIPVSAGADEPGRLLDVVAAVRHQREPGDRALSADLV